MNLYRYLLSPVLALALLTVACRQSPVQFTPGEIDRSISFQNGVFIPDSARLVSDSIILEIRGNDIVIDFDGLVIDGRSLHESPDKFNGIAIRITDSKNVEIRNLTVHGMRYALFAENVDSLKLINCDFSYNYRPRLQSKWDREALSDWLYFHNNENDEWLRYAGAVYLKQCDNALVKNVRSQQGFNALMMDRCNNALIYNNDFRFNSGLGIGMYRSSNNRIMHNRLDFNVRGYSHGKYDRGQDSAGILLYEQCNDNTIAFNSATHSGDGLFLWAGQQTMDSGEGGCNRNIIYRNDFSHSVANGVEATFSSNFIIENKLNDCRYGVWGGYSHNTLISDNEIHNCDHGIAIEHGNSIIIRNNDLKAIPSGVELWERENQPEDWEFAKTRDVASRKYIIEENTFDKIDRTIYLSSTDSVFIDRNNYTDVKTKLELKDAPQPVSNAPALPSIGNIELPKPLADGMDTELESHIPRGRKYMLINEWGPYSFAYPEIFLRRIESEKGSAFDHTFALFGPTGNWKLLPGSKGIESFRPKSGTTPSTIELKSTTDSILKFSLEYLGPEYVNQFGDTIKKGEAPLISFDKAEI